MKHQAASSWNQDKEAMKYVQAARDKTYSRLLMRHYHRSKNSPMELNEIACSTRIREVKEMNLHLEVNITTNAGPPTST